MSEHCLVGRTIVALDLAPDRETLTLWLADGGKVIATTFGDCCSTTWIESIDDEAVLVGHQVVAVEDIEMPDLGSTGTPHRPEVDCVQYYGVRITTTGGVCTVDYRNDSNGYYGGDMGWSLTEAA